MAGIEALDNSIALIGSVVVDADSETELTALTDRVRSAQNALARVLLDITNRANRLHSQGRSGSGEDILSHNRSVPRDTAKREAARAGAVAAVPGLADAFTKGEVTSGHLDIVARRTRNLKPEEAPFLDTDRLLDAAKSSDPDRFDRLARREIERAKNDFGLSQAVDDRQRSKLTMHLNPRTQMGEIHATLDRERYDILRGLIGREVASLAKAAKDDGQPVRMDEHLATDALLSLLDRGSASSGGISRPPITLIVDEATVTSGAHDESIRETSLGGELPPESIQRHLCDAVIEPVLVRDGVAIKTRRTSRTATGPQWAGLRAMYSTCAWDGCSAPLDHCQAHHVQFWEHGGQTDLDNLIPLCTRHHHRVHDLKWGLKLKPDRTLEIRRPDGNLWRSVKPDRAGNQTATGRDG